MIYNRIISEAFPFRNQSVKPILNYPSTKSDKLIEKQVSKVGTVSSLVVR